MTSIAIANLEIAQRHENRLSAFLALGLVECFTGFLATIAADYWPVFNLLSIVAGTLGLAALALTIVQSRSVKVYDVLAAMLLVAYGTGTMNSVISYAMDHQELVADSVISQYWYSSTLALVLAACGCLHIAGRIDPQGYLFQLPKLDRGDRTRVSIFATSLFLLYCVFLITGRIGYAGGISAGNGGPAVSPTASMMTALVTPVGALALFTSLRSTGKSKLFLIVLALSLLVCQFGSGRRIVWFSSIAYAMVALLIVRPKSLLGPRGVLMLAFAVIALQALSTFYVAMRVASYSLRHDSSTKIAVFQLVPKAIDIYIHDERGDLKANVRENYKTRTFVLDYLALIIQRELNFSPLYGDDLHRALVVATPHAFYPTKFRDELFEAEEPLINPRLGLPVWDGPNSILTAGAADFGSPGLFIYPLALSFFYSLILRVINRFARPLVVLPSSVLICQVLLSAESDISGYFSSLISAALILALCSFAFGWKREIQMSS